MEKMFASISVTTFDREELSKYCIETIHKRTPRGEYELIVIDNGSTDGTPEMLKEYETSGVINKLVLNHRNNLGSAINDAWKLADPGAVWLIALSNDSFCMEGWFENFKLIAASELEPDCIFCHMRMPGFEKRVLLKTSNGGFYSYLDANTELFYGAGLALKRELVRRYGLKFREGTKPWGTKRRSRSIYSVMASRLKELNLRTPVDLDKPCILVQDCGYADPKYEEYYRRVFKYRGRRGPWWVYAPITKYESLKKRGAHTRFPDEYYEGTDYVIGEYYRNALNSPEGQAEWDRFEESTKEI